MKNIIDHSTEESIQEFKKGEIDLSTLKIGHLQLNGEATCLIKSVSYMIKEFMLT